MSSSPGENTPSSPSPVNTSLERDIVVSVRGVGKCYGIYTRPLDRLKQTLWRGRRRFHREFWALRNISFDVRRGEAVGIIGRNGSGKSTLLQILAGTLRPTEGQVEIHGRVAALLELGSGFNPEFTGRENVYLNGAIFGLSRQEVSERFDAIAGFADIGSFLDQPVKTYSTGMVVRLAFAVQVQLMPDILIVDEALSVGDALFQKRCFQRIEELRENGVTLLFVSHDQETVRTLTNRALLLENGEPRVLGTSAEVVLEYRRLLHEAEKKYYDEMIRTKVVQRPPRPEPPPAPAETAVASAPVTADEPAAPAPETSEPALKRSDVFSFGDLDAEVVACNVLDENRNISTVFHPGEQIRIQIQVRLNRDMSHLNVGFRLRSKEGVKMYSWGTFNQDVEIWAGTRAGEVFWERRFARGELVTVEFVFDCVLGHNFYEVQAVAAEEQRKSYGAQRILHWRDEAAFFHVHVLTDRHFFGGVCDLRARAAVVSVECAPAQRVG